MNPPDAHGRFDVSLVADKVIERQPGYWTGADDKAVSYPTGGHNFCHGVAADSFWYQHRTRCILAALDRWPPQGPLFDIGGGTGHVASSMVAAGFRAVLVEPGIEGARIAWERGLRPVIQATTHAAGLRRGMIPAIGLFDVVEHVEDDTGFLGHVGDLLTDDGLVFLTVPAHSLLWSVDDVRAGHHRRYDQAALTAALRTAGLQPLYVTSFFRPLPLPVLAVRAVPSRLGLRKVDDRAKSARDHGTDGGVLVRLVKRVLAPEVDRIAEGRRMRVGSSILAVARPAAVGSG